MTPSVGPDAERELIESARYYTREASPELGLAFIASFEHALELLCSNPRMGAVWRGNRRRLPMPRFPFSIIYYVKGDELRVIAIAHHARRPGYWGPRR